jgi:hypothetical protein
MRKGIVGILAIAVAAVICWASGDPWKDKPYSQWDDKDIQRILTNSPWERNVTVAANWEPALPSDNGPGYSGAPQPSSTPAPSGGGGGGMKGGGAPPAGGMSGGAQTGGGMAEMPSIPQATFSVFWMSSRTLRAALGRREVLRSGKSESEVDQYVNQPLDSYEIVVQGRDMTPFIKNDETYFLTHSSIEMKKSKAKVSPSRVTFERGSDGKSVTAALFFFRKKSASGENVIAPDEKDVQFTCDLGKTALKTSFDPRKMSDQKGSDL